MGVYEGLSVYFLQGLTINITTIEEHIIKALSLGTAKRTDNNSRENRMKGNFAWVSGNILSKSTATIPKQNNGTTSTTSMGRNIHKHSDIVCI